MTTDRELAVDVSKWQNVYSDDGIDEGFKKPIMVIQKAADGKYSFFDDGNYNKASTVKMRDSLDGFEIICMYQWIQTEQGVEEQAQAIVRAYLAGGYNGVFFDYESYLNVINASTANKLKQIVERVEELLPSVVTGVYSNNWILNNLVFWLGADWLNSRLVWAAGGSKYNQKLTEQPDDDWHIYTIKDLRVDIEQFSADGNQAADEFDFGTSETASIDVNLINIPRDELLTLFGKGEPEEPEQPEIPEVPEQPVCNCDERISEIRHVTDQFILDTCAKIRKTTATMGEELAKQIEAEGEDLKEFIDTME